MISDTKKVIYAGSFDPATNGHLDIIKRAAAFFGHVIVAIGVSPEKKTLFTPSERVVMLQELTKNIPGVEVQAYSGLTIELAKSVGANVLIRGLRSEQDFSSEMAMAQMNKHLAPEIETFFIPAQSAHFHISSSLVKDVARHQGNVASLVPPLVAAKLAEKLLRSGN